MIEFFISSAYAQTEPQSGGGEFLFMMVIFVGLMYFLIIRPQMKQAKEHKQLISSLQRMMK